MLAMYEGLLILNYGNTQRGDISRLQKFRLARDDLSMIVLT